MMELKELTNQNLMLFGKEHLSYMPIKHQEPPLEILNNPSPTSIFNRIEFPTLILNSKTTNVITGGK